MAEEGHFVFRCFQLFLAHVWILHVAASNPTTQPFNGAFVLQRLNQQSVFLNNTQNTDLYLQNGCPNSPDQVVGNRIGGHYYSANIYTAIQTQNPYCVVNVKLAQEQVYLDRPYVDVIVLRDPAWINLYKYRLCVTVQFTNSAGSSVAGSCILHERHLHKQTCVIRQTIPFSWFEMRAGQMQPSEHLISVSYSIKSQCSAPEFPLFNQRIRLLSTAEKFSVFATNQQADGQLSLLTRQNIQFSVDSLNTVVFHFKPYVNNETRSIIIWVWIDARFEIVSTTALEPNRWRMRVESASEPNSYVTFTLTTIDETDSIDNSLESYLFAMLLRLRNDNERPETTARNDANAFLFVDWSMESEERSFEQFDENLNSTSTKNRITKRIPIVNDSPYTVVAVTKNIDIINTAVLNGLQVSEQMRIFMLSESSDIQDVTDQSHCSSSEPRLLKVSPTCTSVYIDGSELRGLANIYIQVQYKNIRAGAAFNVWYPRLPISVWAADKTLNAVNEWRVPGWKHFDRRRRRRRRQNALQSVCQNRYQQSEIRVLVAFQVIDETTGEQSYLSGSRDQLFDVTQIVMGRVQVTDSQILSVKRKDDRLVVSGKSRGTARVVVRAVNSNIDYGGTQISVSDESVSAVQLLLRLVTDVQLEMKPKHGMPFQYDLSTRIQSEFTQQNQHGSLEIEIFYSDGQRELLSDVDTSLYALSIYSASEQALRIRQQKGSPNIELVMLADSQMDSLLTAEMRGPNTCEETDLPALAAGQTRLRSQLKRSFHLMDGRQYPDAERIQLNITGESSKNEDSSIGLQPILALLLILLFIFGIFHFVSIHSKGFHNGYEKLVMPLIARLSSNGSLASEQVAEGDGTNEWVWMPKNQLDNVSVASHFSQRSTLGISNGTTLSNGTSSSSSDSISTNCGTTKSISYRGSEISVFLAPNAASVSVNEDHRVQHRQMATWRSNTNGRSNRLQRPLGGRYRYNEMGTSSVHDNLDKYCRNVPLGQNGRANSTLNGIMRRSSDQMHQNGYFSNYNKKSRKEPQRFRVAPDQSTMNAEDEFFAVRPQSSNQSMAHVPFLKDTRSALPSYASVYSNDGLQHGDFVMTDHRDLYMQPQNGWIQHHSAMGSQIDYAPQQTRNYSSRSNAIRETVA